MSRSRHQHQQHQHQPGRLTDSAQMREFVTAGNATFTLKSSRTGTRFTFHVLTARDAKGKPQVPEKFWVQLLTGPDKYTHIGHLKEGRFFFISKPYAPAADSPGIKGFEWFWGKLPGKEGQTTEKDEKALELLEFWHEGTCGRCGRQLTVPESIASGIGPECAQRLAVVGLLDTLMGTTTEDDFDEQQ